MDTHMYIYKWNVQHLGAHIFHIQIELFEQYLILNTKKCFTNSLFTKCIDNIFQILLFYSRTKGIRQVFMEY